MTRPAMRFFWVASVFLLALSSVFAQKETAGKHALIITIGKYPTDSTGWPCISSDNDAGLIQTALQKQGFSDIRLLQDQEATKAGILRAFKKFTESDSVKPGDIVVVHISSHGQQIQDFSGDELDGLDEAIVAYGAPADQEHAFGYKGRYKGEKHLIDDDFGILTQNLRKKLGPKGELVVFIDACHSGTGTRGSAGVRGGKPALVLKDYIEKKDTTKNNEVFLYEKGGDLDASSLAHFVVFSGARAKELNYEYKVGKTGYGSLSYAVSQALAECDKEETYRSLFARVLSIMAVIAPNQNPTIEGDIDMELFRGNIVAQEPYKTIYSIKNVKSIVINGGILDGIYDSSKVAVYPAGTVNTKDKKPLTTGVVTRSVNFTSAVSLKDSLKIKNKNDAWVFVTDKAFGNIGIKVEVGDFKNVQLKKFVENDLEKNKIATLVGDSAELILLEGLGSHNDVVEIKVASNGVVYNSVIKENIDSVLLVYAQSKFIKELDVKDSTVRIEMEFIPVTKDKQGNYSNLDIKNYTVNGIPEFNTSVVLLIKLKNKGKKDAYFNIIDIQPDGKINAVLPSLDPKNYQPSDYFLLKAGSERIIKDFEITLSPPFGKEVYKVFGTKAFIDLSFVINSTGTKKRGNEQAIETLFKNSYTSDSYTTRGDQPRITAASGVNTFNYTFIIKEK
jgi:metacaspase-1